MMPDLMHYIYERALSPLRQVWPGVVLSFTIAMAATFISDHHGGPTLLYALLVGMAFHFLSKGTAVAAGINFTARTILRIGVALIGIRISTGQIAQLGAIPVLLVIVGVPATLIVGRFLAPSLGLTSSQGILTGGAVAICGVSAALAISSVLPKTKDSERDTLFTAIAVTLIGMVAMVCYPAIAHVIGLDTSATGILLGASIHDVSQVVGAGLLVSDQAGIVATYVKLLRVTMLVPVVLGLAWIFVPDKAGTRVTLRGRGTGARHRASEGRPPPGAALCAGSGLPCAPAYQQQLACDPARFRMARSDRNPQRGDKACPVVRGRRTCGAVDHPGRAHEG
jgi:uncharacterized integral membrane protein (TIGR00698 family)